MVHMSWGLREFVFTNQEYVTGGYDVWDGDSVDVLMVLQSCGGSYSLLPLSHRRVSHRTGIFHCKR